MKERCPACNQALSLEMDRCPKCRTAIAHGAPPESAGEAALRRLAEHSEERETRSLVGRVSLGTLLVGCIAVFVAPMYIALLLLLVGLGSGLVFLFS